MTSASPGDVLCLEAGTRGRLRLTGLTGSANRPIVIRNHGGVVNIDARGAWSGIEIRNSSHLHITGTGVESRCGARFAEDQQRCGIRVSGSEDGLTGRTRTEHLTVDHLEVGNVSDVGVDVWDKTVGRNGWVQRNIAFRDVYVHDLPTGEGHYHGSSDYRAGSAGLLDGVEITRNLIARTGRDGIQVGSTPWNCTIRDNVVRNAGLTRESSHMFGIVVNRGASCDIIGNDIADTGRAGIYDQGLSGQVISDNVVRRAGIVTSHSAIEVREGDQASNNPQTPDFPRSTKVLRNSVDRAATGIGFCNKVGRANEVIGNSVANVSGAATSFCSGSTARTR